MRKFLVLALLAISTVITAQEKRFVIKGEMSSPVLCYSNESVTEVKLEQMVDGQMVVTATAPVIDNKFVFEGVVPAELGLFNITGFDNGTIQLFIEEPYAQGKWFGVQILKRKRYEFTGLVPENIRKQYEKQNGIEEFDEICEKETITDNNGLVSVRSNMIVGLNGGDMMITEGMKRDEKTTCLQIPVKITGKTLVASSSHENYKIYEYHEYKTRLYRLTKESYSYLKSRYIAENSSTLIDLGFSPVNYSYTNITGGLGIFAGTATYDSEWTAYNDYWHDYVPKE